MNSPGGRATPGTRRLEQARLEQIQRCRKAVGKGGDVVDQRVQCLLRDLQVIRHIGQFCNDREGYARQIGMDCERDILSVPICEEIQMDEVRTERGLQVEICYQLIQGSGVYVCHTVDEPLDEAKVQALFRRGIDNLLPDVLRQQSARAKVETEVPGRVGA